MHLLVCELGCDHGAHHEGGVRQRGEHADVKVAPWALETVRRRVRPTTTAMVVVAKSDRAMDAAVAVAVGVHVAMAVPLIVVSVARSIAVAIASAFFSSL